MLTLCHRDSVRASVRLEHGWILSKLQNQPSSGRPAPAIVTPEDRHSGDQLFRRPRLTLSVTATANTNSNPNPNPFLNGGPRECRTVATAISFIELYINISPFKTA